jgi:hypothetical protein
MAVPFGGHPPLERFVEWAKGVGCKVEIKVRTHAVHGRPYKSLEITGPGGAQVAIANPNMAEHLAPSMVAYLQRRIGLRSPFPATPEQPDPTTTEYVEVPDDPKEDNGQRGAVASLSARKASRRVLAGPGQSQK